MWKESGHHAARRLFALFTPPPFELVGGDDHCQVRQHHAAPEVTTADPPVAERADYFDAGLEHKFPDHLTMGLDTYYRQSKNLIDEGQFGAPIILTPFNYKDGRIKGVELTANYAREAFSAYANLAAQSARGATSKRRNSTLQLMT